MGDDLEQRCKELEQQNKDLLSEINKLSMELRKERTSQSRQLQVASQRRRAVEVKYRSLLESMMDVVYQLDTHGYIQYLNRAGEEFLGQKREDLRDQLLLRYFTRESARKAINVFETTLDGKRTAAELTLQTGKTAEFRSQPIQNEGKIIGIVGMARDITQRKRVEELMRLQRDLGVVLGATRSLEESLEASLDAALSIEGVDCGGVYIIGEDEVLRMEYNKGLGQEFVEHTKCFGPGTPQYKIVMSGEVSYRTYDSEFAVIDDIRKKEGLRSIAVIPLKYESRIIGGLNIASHEHPTINARSRDALETIAAQVSGVIARAKAEEKLKRSEEEYRTLVENVNFGVYRSTSDMPGRWLKVNRAMAHMLGYETKEECAKVPVASVYDDPKEREIFIRTLETHGKAERIPVNLRRKNGTRIICLSTARAQKNNEGKIVWYDGVLEDITEMRRIEEERRLLDERIQQTLRMEAIGTLASGVAHDFNNSLTGIIGNMSLALEMITQILQEKEESELGALQGYIMESHQTAWSAAELPKKLLNIAKGGKPELRATDLNSLIEESLGIFRRSYKGVEIKTHLDPELGTVSIDKHQIKTQVLTNLYVNAMQAMQQKGTLELATRNATIAKEKAELLQVQYGDYVMISVKDEGCGMSRQTRERIFEPFYTTKSREQGTGLGLYSAYTVLRAHNGAIEVESESGKGTEFKIYLPVRNMMERIDQMQEQRIRRGKERILVVDDERVIRKVMKANMTGLGYDVILAESGEEAIRRYDDSIDLVLLDMTMPGMDGAESYLLLKEKDPQAKIIIMSGNPSSDQIKYLLEEGAKGFLNKPYTKETLSRKIREALA